MMDDVEYAFPRLFAHIVTHVSFFLWMQFETDYVVESTLTLSDELLNTKYKGKLEPTYKVLG